jgi:hypothetical protein
MKGDKRRILELQEDDLWRLEISSAKLEAWTSLTIFVVDAVSS